MNDVAADGASVEEREPLSGAVADREVAQELCGREIPEELLKLKLWGRLVLLVREPAETAVGGIVIPEAVQDKWPKSTGWIISAGPMVGTYEPGLKNYCPFTAQEVIYLRVLFSRYAGTGLPVVDETGRMIGSASEYGADFVLMRDEEILANY